MNNAPMLATEIEGGNEPHRSVTLRAGFCNSLLKSPDIAKPATTLNTRLRESGYDEPYNKLLCKTA